MYELSALDGSQHQTISLFWPFMFRINLWVVVVALVAVSVAGGGAEDTESEDGATEEAPAADDAADEASEG